MEFCYLPLGHHQKSTGIVVVIDVLRAFSTAAYAFSAGVQEIITVDKVTDAFLMKQRFPEAKLVGEVDGLPINQFDYGNSPSSFLNQDLSGVKLIQRTSCGTMGLISNKDSDLLIAACLCCARATARYISIIDPQKVTFIISGSASEDNGADDLACANYIEALLMGIGTRNEEFVKRVKKSTSAQKFLDPGDVDFPCDDLDLCLMVDRFNFAMVADRQEDLLILKPVDS